MKWEGLNLHIENLIPGTIIVVMLLSVVPESLVTSVDSSVLAVLFRNSIIQGGVFMSVAYMVGVFTASIARLIIDPLSAAGPRIIFLKLFVSEDFRDQWTGVNNKFRSAVKNAQMSENEAKRNEIRNRREKTRILRSGVIPLILGTLVLTQDCPISRQLMIAIAALILGVLLYAYLEVTIYQEAILGHTTQELPVSKKKNLSVTKSSRKSD